MTYKFKNQLVTLGLLLIGCCLFVRPPAFAKEITILYTGQTHSMLYPCSCPIERDGGLTRRATLVNQLRKANTSILLLDTGNVFAGGMLDEYTQNSEFDKQRTQITLQAMQEMRYDAVALGDDEFNFGLTFLTDQIQKGMFPFLSANVDVKGATPFIIKEVDGVRFGIIGLTSLSAQQKLSGLNMREPAAAITVALQELKKQKVDIIAVLSNLSEGENKSLLEKVSGVDIMIIGSGQRLAFASKVGAAIVVQSVWQGRKLGTLKLVVEDKKIKDFKVEEMRVSDQLADDPGILSFLPSCFSDKNCKKNNSFGTCINPGTMKSACKFADPAKINLTVITTKDCQVCDTTRVVDSLKNLLPGLQVSTLYYPQTQAKALIKELGIAGLPAYLLGKEVEKEAVFNSLKASVEAKGNYYKLLPQMAGLGYFLERKLNKGQFDVFVSLFDSGTAQILESVKPYNPTVHFLAVQKDSWFEARQGRTEVEEYLRSVCVQKYYPQLYWDYIICRAKQGNSTWWDDCLKDIETERIKTCARGQEGGVLLAESIMLNKELQVLFGPTYLVHNQQIFSSTGAPTKEELDRIIKGQVKR
ncbi:MAG: hypothetical protein KBA46_00570 [Candidatus Omnitrophica bacterium]|nr:hypothetical protein [Candidatus Omnitrophota bacterium]